MLRKAALFAGCILIMGFFACKNRKPGDEVQQEDKQAKSMLQGIWEDEDDETVAFMAKGDSIFYPDSTSQPVKFKIIADTLFLEGANIVKYPIIKRGLHIFQFKNQNGELVKLIKSEDPEDSLLFVHNRPRALNQNKLIKRDTVVMNGNERYHCYVQVNPTTYKVIKSSYNDDGVEVDNVYYDNIIHISVFKGAQELYSHDFRKNEFARQIPSQFLRQAILSDMEFDNVGNDGITYKAILGIPDEMSNYIVKVKILYNGKVQMSV